MSRTRAGFLIGGTAALLAILLIIALIDARIIARWEQPELVLQNSSLVFRDPSNVSLSIAQGNGRLDWSVSDVQGHTVDSGSIPSATEATISPHIPSVGYFTFRARSRTSSISASFLATGNPPTTKDEFFSVATHWGKASFASSTWPLSRTLPLLQSIGFHQFRDETEWSSVERTKGVFTVPQHSVEMTKDTQNAGMSMMLVADYGNPRIYEDMHDALTPPTTPESTAAFVDYINKMIEKKPNITKVEVWNEFNRSFRNTSTCQSGSCYARLVRAVYEGVKSKNPQIEIVAGNTASTPIPWFEDFMKAGGLRWCDAISTHGYANDTARIREDIGKLAGLIRKYSSSKPKPIIVSEIGISNTTSTNPRGNVARVKTEAQAADAMVKIYATLKSIPDVSQVVWYDGVDDGSDRGDGEANFGLFRQPTESVRAFQPKQAAAAAARSLRELSGAKFIATSSTQRGARVSTFEDESGHRLRIAWVEAPFAADHVKPVKVRIDVAEGKTAKVISPTGEVLETLASGQSTIEVGGSPVFIRDEAAAP